jgi:Flp pilus assembly protein TadG
MDRRRGAGFGRLLRAFAVARAGATASLLAVAMPAIGAVVAGAVDYAAVSQNRSRLQAVIDSAAIAVAREMTVTPVTNDRAQTMAETYVAANIPANTPFSIAATAQLLEEGMAVRVTGTQTFQTPFGLIERVTGTTSLTATALARVSAPSESKLCLLSLGRDAKGGIYMHNGAKISASDCVFHSNSTDKKAVILSQNSVIKARQICARGGIKTITSAVEGAMVTDCPDLKDPLAAKPEPTAPLMCSGTKMLLKSGSHNLKPGTYCDGMTITGSAKVTLEPGVYFFRSGVLRVEQSAELVGRGVTLIFTGTQSYFRFEGNALIQLNAPESGATAGMLIWESVNMIPLATNATESITGVEVTKTKIATEHHINSDRARELTGTIYLRKGLLMIDSRKPIADLSPYTIMVVEKLDLFDGPELVLNSNYSGTKIPVPTGLGPVGGREVRLGM